MIAYIKARAKEFFTWFGLVAAAALPALQSFAGFEPKIAYIGAALGVALAVVKTP